MKKKLMILLTLITISVSAQNTNDSVILLELFTSQGCSSCPPADELIDTVKEVYKGQNVNVLSYHVDYWNRLGWKDPFSQESYSDYQREYATKFRSRSIYTPQIVVNGSEHFVGSNSFKTNASIKKYGKTKSKNTIALSELKKDNESIQLSYQVNGESFDQVTFALVVSERITKVKRGENSNRTLKNSNIVASRAVQKEASGVLQLVIPDWVNQKDELSVIVYTQDRDLKITGVSNQKV